MDIVFLTICLVRLYNSPFRDRHRFSYHLPSFYHGKTLYTIIHSGTGENSYNNPLRMDIRMMFFHGKMKANGEKNDVVSEKLLYEYYIDDDCKSIHYLFSIAP